MQPPAQSSCRGTVIGFVVFIVILIIIFVVLVVTGVIHFGKQPAPSPSVKATCAEYSPATCQGSRTSTGKVCEFKAGVCVEFIPPGPIPPTPLDPVSIAAWFLANPSKRIIIRPPGKLVGYQISYEGLNGQGEAMIAVEAIRYKSGDIQEVTLRTIYDITNAGALHVESSLINHPQTVAGSIDSVAIDAINTINVIATHKQATGGNPYAVLYAGLGAQQRSGTGTVIAQMQPLNL